MIKDAERACYDYRNYCADGNLRFCVQGDLFTMRKHQGMFLDDCMAAYFGLVNWANFVTAKYRPSEYSQYLTESAVGTSGYYGGTFYYDAAGNQYSSPPAGTQICDAGTFEWYISPISLLLEPDVNVDKDISLVNFPLDPSKPGRWFAWKASDKAPLLVYDPEHTGRIESASQLFGNWTFGGKRVASVTTDANTFNSSAWANGYEALGSLDSDNDGVVSKGELAPLALWYDSNRNGVSEAGEVGSLDEAGITALYYQPDKHEKQTNNLIANKGFERTVDGRQESGASVDWYSDSAETKAELLDIFLRNGDPTEAEQQAPPADTNNSDSAEIKGFPISGLWEWHSNDQLFTDRPNAPKGYFGLSEQGEGKFKGHTYSEMSLPIDGQNISMVTIAGFKGLKDVVSADETTLEFTIQRDKTTIKNTAILSKDGQKLNGVSTVELTYQGKPISVQYKWTAERKTFIEPGTEPTN